MKQLTDSSRGGPSSLRTAGIAPAFQTINLGLHRPCQEQLNAIPRPQCRPINLLERFALQENVGIRKKKERLHKSSMTARERYTVSTG